jgi:hypothetical protein
MGFTFSQTSICLGLELSACVSSSANLKFKDVFDMTGILPKALLNELV